MMSELLIIIIVPSSVCNVCQCVVLCNNKRVNDFCGVVETRRGVVDNPKWLILRNGPHIRFIIATSQQDPHNKIQDPHRVKLNIKDPHITKYPT